jgi:hypothetical protein
VAISTWAAAVALCWLGIGLWVLANGARRARVTGRAAGSAGALGARLLSLVLVGAAGAPLVSGLGIGFGGVALLLLAMSAASLAVVSFSLWPRAYAASLPVAALVAIAVRWC